MSETKILDELRNLSMTIEAWQTTLFDLRIKYGPEAVLAIESGSNGNVLKVTTTGRRG